MTNGVQSVVGFALSPDKLFGPRREKTCLRFDSNQPAQLQGLARKLNFGLVLFKKRITRALIRLVFSRRCPFVQLNSYC